MVTKKDIRDGYDKIYDKIFMSDRFYQSCIKIVDKIQGGGPLYFSGVLKNIEPVVVFMFPYLNKKMKRLIILSENVKYYGS